MTVIPDTEILGRVTVGWGWGHKVSVAGRWRRGRCAGNMEVTVQILYTFSEKSQ